MVQEEPDTKSSGVCEFEMSTRVCGKCKVGKVECEANFGLRKYKSGKTYYHSICKECCRLVALQWVTTHREECREYQRQYRANNPEYKKQWKSNNRDKIRQQDRDRRVSDINYKLRKNVSRAIERVITKNSASTFKCLPYTVQELKEHLEHQFDSNMSWNNYGTYWHIDHIIPHSTFQYTSMEDDAFKRCWALNNLRPLEAHQNMLDGATRVRHKK